MKKPALYATCLIPALAFAEGGALSGPTGLLTVPTAEVLEEGGVRIGLNLHDAVPADNGTVNYLFNIGFAPGLELGGRIAQREDFNDRFSDLSFNAKLRLWTFDNGLSIAIGGQDIGGEQRNYRSRYAVATLPWHTFTFTAGYDQGPDVLAGALAGLEWRPWTFFTAYAEYDSEEINPGLRLESPPLWGGLRIGGTAGYRTGENEFEGGIQFRFPLGRKAEALSPLPAIAKPEPSAREDAAPQIAARPISFEQARELRAALEGLGFESVRTGVGADGTLAVTLENRRYNHSSADGIGIALGAIARNVPAQVGRVELTQTAYGVPQVTVATVPASFREFLFTGIPSGNLLDVRNSKGPAEDTQWHNAATPLMAGELVIEPVLRTFVASDFGVLEAGVGTRARLTAPAGRGVVAHVGLQLPMLLTEDFRDGGPYETLAPDADLDLMLLQYAHKVSAGWAWLWSVGRMQVFQADLTVAALEQAWTSPGGRHRLHGKLMALDGRRQREVALAGYTWFDAPRRYSAGVTGGRFYDGDSGVRLDVNRHFGDTIAGLFLKVEGRENMAGGFQISVPLTPRRDAIPLALQVKGARRWGHSLQTTLNLADGTNQLKPLLLYEPVLDLDLRRDFLDSGRLGADYLEEQLPRMREAWELYGGG